jgi:hypothetical protein
VEQSDSRFANKAVGEIAYIRFMRMEGFNPTTVGFVTLYDVYQNRVVMEALHNREFLGHRLDVETVHFGQACLVCHQNRVKRAARNEPVLAERERGNETFNEDANTTVAEDNEDDE